MARGWLQRCDWDWNGGAGRCNVPAAMCKLFDYITNMLLDFVSQLCYKPHQPRSSRGVSGDGPVGGARRGVPRLRLVTVSPGRSGTPSARHYDLAARSSLHGSGGNAGDGSTGPRPKIATVERREARVPPLRGARRLASAWRAAQKRVHARLGRARHVAGAAAPERRLGAPPPLVGWQRKGSNPGRKCVAGTRKRE